MKAHWLRGALLALASANLAVAESYLRCALLACSIVGVILAYPWPKRLPQGKPGPKKVPSCGERPGRDSLN